MTTPMSSASIQPSLSSSIPNTTTTINSTTTTSNISNSTTTTLLDTLNSEINSLCSIGNQQLNNLIDDSNKFLLELKQLELELENDIKQEHQQSTEEGFTLLAGDLLKISDEWYNSSISSLKSYNSSLNKVSKNVLNNTKFNIDLDDAYTYPLNLNSFPMKSEKENIIKDDPLQLIKAENRTELIKSIMLHLLKIGQCDIVDEVMKELPTDHSMIIDEDLSSKFQNLHKIVDNIVSKHDLSMALEWLKMKYNQSILSNQTPPDHFNNIEFKFHMLQFIILLNGSHADFNLDDVFAAYEYAKDNFGRFFHDYLNEISPLVILLLFKTNNPSEYDEFSKKDMINAVKGFIERMKIGFNLENDKKSNHTDEVKFISELLASFEHIHNNQSIFVNISNEFISEYCKDLKLSNDSSLFQSILAGHIYLPSFYKYNQIQTKLAKFKSTPSDKSRSKSASPDQSSPKQELVVNNVATYHNDLPFQLPDTNRFLFNYHPIFICPVSREQLIPITEHIIEQNGKKYIVDNPMVSQVVVLKYCQHLALRDSVYHLSKKGTDLFKCHYCYKKHKYSEVTDGYFIDL